MPVYKGTINCSGNPNYPAADSGWEYIVSASGRIGGASGKIVTTGDLVVCDVNSSPAGNEAMVGANWDIVALGAPIVTTTWIPNADQQDADGTRPYGNHQFKRQHRVG